MAGSIGVLILVLLVLSTANTADLTCPYGRELSLCYSGCPKSCATLNTTSPTCTGPCSAGCFCPDGLVQFDEDICVDPSLCLSDGTSGDIPAVDQCSGYGSCDECISSNPACQWCPYLPEEQSVKGSRCRDRVLNPYCPVALNDPQPSVTPTANNTFSDSVLIRPQKLKLKLRVGQPKQFTLKFKLSENYPLDVYFLLDVTGSFAKDFRETVIPLATDLVNVLQTISLQYSAGFGNFGDKRASPFSLAGDSPKTYYTQNIFGNDVCTNNRITLPNCNPAISFRHTNSLKRLESAELAAILSNISIHLSVDKPEGGMDALMQALLCEDIIGWRQESLRMVVYFSDDIFHLAGDGKLGAAFRRNPGQCNLQREEQDGIEFYEYSDALFYDYPSLYQIRDAIRNSQTNVVLAVTNKEKDVYELLQKELDLGRSVQVTEVLGDSSNIISVIRSSYDGITQEVRLSTSPEIPELRFSYTPGINCNFTDDSDGCSGVFLGDTVALTVNVTMDTCLKNTTIVNIRSPAFGQVELEIEPLCQCPCTAEQVLEDETYCNGNGTLTCGKCVCDTGRSGAQCQCAQDAPTCCRGLDNQTCSGRGRGKCECDHCDCFVQEDLLSMFNKTMAYFGDCCECDNVTSCGGSSDGGPLCLGRGICDCITNICTCTARAPRSGLVYEGNMCQCDPDICYNDQFPNRTCVYIGGLEGTPDATCECNRCNCRSDAEAINGTCREKTQDSCSVNEQCARCVKDHQSTGINCTELRIRGCMSILYRGSTIPRTHTDVCSYKDSDDCIHSYYLSLTLSTVLVDDDRDCPSGGQLSSLAWIIPVSVIGGLLLLGLIILLIVLLAIWILDRYEFKKFQKNLSTPNWNSSNNPLYVSPQQQYTNIAYKRSRRVN